MQGRLHPHRLAVGLLGCDGGQEGAAKKLIEAARRWAKGSPGDSAASAQQQRDGLRELGVSEEQIDAMLETPSNSPLLGGEQGERDFLVWPENWDCVQVFCSLGSRWRPDAMSGRFYGLERADIVGTLQLMRIETERYSQLFGDLQIMEQAALQELNS